MPPQVETAFSSNEESERQMNANRNGLRSVGDGNARTVNEIDLIHRVPAADDSHEAILIKRYDSTPILRRYLLEIIFMLYVFHTMILMVPTTDIFMQKSCLYNLGYNDTVCNDLDHYKDYQNEVQIETKYYTLLKDVINTLPGAAASLLSGQHMSRYGMKAPLIIAMLGTWLSSLILMYTFCDMEVPLIYSVLAIIPSAITGGMVIFLTAVYTKITLSVPTERRKNRFLHIQFFMFLPIVLAMALGGTLYDAIGIRYLTAGTIMFQLIPFILMILLFRDEELSDSAKQDGWRQVLQNTVSVSVLRESFSFFIRARPRCARAQLYCMFVCLMFGVVAFSGLTNLEQLYLNKIYNWDASTFSIVSSTSMAMIFVLSIPTMVLFTKVYHLSDPSMVALGFACFGIKFILMSLMELSKFFYGAELLVGLPFIVSMSAIRSHMSRLLAAHEVAVIFALMSALERLVPIFADLLVTFIYTHSIDFFPGLVFVVLGALFIIPVALAGLSRHLLKHHGYPDYKHLAEETEDTVEGRTTKAALHVAIA